MKKQQLGVWNDRHSGQTVWPHDWSSIYGKECEVILEPRPPYCDRGNFVAKIFPTGQLALDMDSQDCWPRYYMDETRAKLEILDWLKKRRQL